MTSYLKPESTLYELNVPAITLDTLLEKFSLNKVDVIKVDVEGAGFKVLKGAQKILLSTNQK